MFPIKHSANVVFGLRTWTSGAMQSSLTEWPEYCCSGAGLLDRSVVARGRVFAKAPAVCAQVLRVIVVGLTRPALNVAGLCWCEIAH